METIRVNNEESYADSLINARAAWVSYDNPCSVKPIFALMDVLEQPEIAEHPVIARQIMQMLCNSILTKIKVTKLSIDEKPYYDGLFPQDKYYEYATKRNGFALWCTAVLHDWPNNPTTGELFTALRFIFEVRFDRWYVNYSCDDYQPIVLRILDDALKNSDLLESEDNTWKELRG